MNKQEAFALWASKAGMDDGHLPWETDRKVLETVFTAGWDAHVEAGKQTVMFAVDEITPEAIYAAYPRKEGRGDAIRAISKAMKKVKPADLLKAVQDYAAVVKTWPQTARFAADGRSLIPMPARWMNDERYADDRTTWQRGGAVAHPSQFQRTYQ
jgi:hypothetical protein